MHPIGDVSRETCSESALQEPLCCGSPPRIRDRPGPIIRRMAPDELKSTHEGHPLRQRGPCRAGSRWSTPARCSRDDRIATRALLMALSRGAQLRRFHVKHSRNGDHAPPLLRQRALDTVIDVPSASFPAFQSQDTYVGPSLRSTRGRQLSGVSREASEGRRGLSSDVASCRRQSETQDDTYSPAQRPARA